MNDPVVITLTDREDLLSLMENEFHGAGSRQFAPEEAKNYIRRLTENQRSLLASDRVPVNHLTAFITFGDGFFDRPMGAYCDTLPGKDNLRPNASFALFFKQKSDDKLKINLVFYTVSVRCGRIHGLTKVCHPC